MKTIRTGEFPNFVYEVAYPAFEVWWKERLYASPGPICCADNLCSHDTRLMLLAPLSGDYLPPSPRSPWLWTLPLGPRLLVPRSFSPPTPRWFPRRRVSTGSQRLPDRVEPLGSSS